MTDLMSRRGTSWAGPGRTGRWSRTEPAAAGGCGPAGPGLPSGGGPAPAASPAARQLTPEGRHVTW